MSVPRGLRPLLFAAALMLTHGAGRATFVAADDLALPAVAPAPVAPDLSGVWNLDPTASDDLKAFVAKLPRPAAGHPGKGGPGGGPGGGGPGVGGPGGGGGRMPADELGSAGDDPTGSFPSGPGAGGGPGAVLARAAQQLLISRDGEAIEILDGADRTESWIPDGEARAQTEPGGQLSMRRAAWQEGALILEQLGGPQVMTRRLQLAADGRRLLVELTATGADGKPLTAHLEYAGVH